MLLLKFLTGKHDSKEMVQSFIIALKFRLMRQCYELKKILRFPYSEKRRFSLIQEPNMVMLFDLNERGWK
jgi:hypothetical protein